MHKQFLLSLLAILLLALLACAAVLFGMGAMQIRPLWLGVVGGGMLVCAMVATFRYWGESGNDGAPQADASSEVSNQQALDGLARQLRNLHGYSWPYRQRWLVLAGNDEAIADFLPELQEQRWLITADAVLLWCKSDAHGQPDEAWLKQLRTLRRRRPVDAVVLTVGDASTLTASRHTGGTYNMLLTRMAEALQWQAPVVVLDLHGHDNVHHGAMVAGSEFAADADANVIEEKLRTLGARLASISMLQLGDERSDRYAGELSQRLDTRRQMLATWIAGLHQGRSRHTVSGVFFAPYPRPAAADAAADSGADLPLWQHLMQAVHFTTGRRVGWHPETVFCTIALTGLGLWMTGMLVSGIVNQRDLAGLHQMARRVEHAPGSAERLRGLLALQQEIARYEYRTQHHAPLMARFGLNRDDAILTALWRPYVTASQRMLVAPVQQTLETELIDLTQLRSDQRDQQGSRFAVEGHQSLKTYLMLAQPQRSEAAFLTPQLIQRWQLDTQLPAGEQRDLAERLLTFYSTHLAAHPDWRITPSEGLVQASRQTLLAAIGVEHADSTLYRHIITAATDKYPDQTLASLTAGTDPRGLMRNNAVVSGVFTRQAYEGVIAAAIADAAQRNTIVSDWVLTGQAQQAKGHSASQTPESLQAALTAQYFADYAEQWQSFMNNVQWEAAPTMPAAIEQLKLMADDGQSPVIALMKSLQYQGIAGVRQASLSDTLVAKAQNLITSTKTETAPAQQSNRVGPLGNTFRPVLRLIGNLDGNAAAGTNANAQANSDLSLQRYLDRISALRLKLQQINSSPDAEAQSKQLALSLFQGKSSELADTQAYAQLVAASLGEQWAGMGDALFVHPVAQATQAVLQPAQAGLNEAWNNGIVAAWYKAFSGRYPFALTDNDASFPELSRFLKPQSGLIATFLQSQLAGVLELQGDQWVPNAGSKLNFDSAFLAAVNTLQRIGSRLLVQGEPQYRFELKPMPTPGITDTVLTIDAQKLRYRNERETWQNMVWPVNQTQDVGTRLQWETEKAGINKRYEFTGRWGFIRMLERAHVEPIDSATYQLTWQGSPDATQANSVPASSQAAASDSMLPRAPMAPATAELAYPLSYVMRTEAGRGPLEMLSLRDFSLPSRIFSGAPRSANKK